ncbi:putative NAD-dependent oxidoreductase [Handroanthus impetiginosus]|uniref:Putative NAD-dependent oxidoreductase n=1 Tax=Handroanthus impetiginosus TaxID=429701 RepID=A0A2G9G1R9_9LAMI|nr:putative NAD-dependent oxidoreductase [Handroanthus impetiginosus]
MEEVIENKFIAIKSHINGAPIEFDFEVKTETISLSAKSKEVIVKNLYVSIDPYQLHRMKSCSSSQTTIYLAAPVQPGQSIDTYGVGRVVASGRPDFAKDDLVVGLLAWGEYTVVEEGRLLNKLDPMGLPLPYHVGPLGFSGLTAYAGFFEICKPKKGENVFVSAASGSVGSLVGQYAKLFGCHVVGCAGSQKKVDLLKEKLGFDDAFNYKDETDLNSALKRYFPNGIDIYFDNVGGEMLEAAVANMNKFGRVALCGVISEYTGGGKRPALEMLDVVYKRITIQGFLAADHTKNYGDFISTITDHLRTGKMQALCDISHGLESIPSAFVGLFRGDNIGKKIVQIAHE